MNAVYETSSEEGEQNSETATEDALQPFDIVTDMYLSKMNK
jgi:hypothetical protein